MSCCADSLIEEICSSLRFFLITPLQLLSFGGVAGVKPLPVCLLRNSLGCSVVFSADRYDDQAVVKVFSGLEPLGHGWSLPPWN